MFSDKKLIMKYPKFQSLEMHEGQAFACACFTKKLLHDKCSIQWVLLVIVFLVPFLSLNFDAAPLCFAKLMSLCCGYVPGLLRPGKNYDLQAGRKGMAISSEGLYTYLT
jgi:hypothetical protein